MIKSHLQSLFYTLFIAVFTISLSAQNQSAKVVHSQGKFLGKSSPLTTWKHKAHLYSETMEKAKKMKTEMKGIPNFKANTPFPRDFSDRIRPKNGDPLVQLQSSMNKSINMDEITILQDYDGIDFNDSGIWPPDCNGDIGLNYYVMTTNGGAGTILHIYDKFTGELVEETLMTPLWAELGASPFGDPILFFDRLEERWVLTEFTFSSMLIAVSETSDPLGAYNAYEYQTGGLPDYPKYSNWDDAYFITTNEFNGFNPVYALDKAAMIAGEIDPTIIQFQDMTKFDDYGASFEVSSPIDFSGTILPEDGTNFMAIRITDDEFDSDLTDGIQYYEFDPNFDDPNASLVTGPVDIATAPYESNLCGYGLFDCLTQSDGSLLSAIHTVIMNRVQYRNLGEYESILLNFSVDITGNNDSGVRWMELRKQEDSNWELYQEGTYSTDDGVSRFMGTLTQDSKGNILMAYAMVGPDTDPGVGVTGRRTNDPPGIMTFAEQIVIEGEQPSPVARWGDYFSVTVDPADDATFWLTSEYMPSDQDWSTRLTSFSIRRDSLDAALAQLVSPVSSDALTDTENVTIRIANPGYLPISDVSWGVMLDGNLIESGVAVGILDPLATIDVVLNNTVDLSALGSYDFVSYVSLEDDEYILNDTLRSVVTKNAMYDLEVLSSSGNSQAGCKDEVDFTGSFRNNGTQPITSFMAEIYVNDVIQMTVPWTGELVTNDVVTVDFLDIPVQDGANDIKIAVIDVLGSGAEEVLDNNEVIFVYTKIANPIVATLSFMSDGFSNETSWQITDENDVIIYEGSGYSGTLAEDIVELCLNEACYTFTLFDSFGDGWGGSTSAFLEITQEDGVKVVILDNTSFGSEWSMEFCVPKACEDLEAEIEYEDATGPGVPDAAIFINFAAADDNTEYSIDGGATFQSSPLFTNLVDGVYDIVVKDFFGCTFEETINVLVGNEELDNEINFTINPNPSNGILKVAVTGITGPEDLDVIIIDQTGKKVRGGKLYNFSNGYRNTILIPNLPAGAYYMAIQGQEYNAIKKFIKQ